MIRRNETYCETSIWRPLKWKISTRLPSRLKCLKKMYLDPYIIIYHIQMENTQS